MSERSFDRTVNEFPPSSESGDAVGCLTSSTEAANFDLRLAMDAIPTIIWIALPDGSAEFFNKKWTEYTNLSAADSEGFGWSKAVHPEDLAGHTERWRMAVATCRPFEDEVRIRGADGTYHWFLCRGTPIHGAAGEISKWYGQLTDIEDRKQAEARIRQAEAALRLAMDTMPAMAWRAGPDGSSEFVNRGWLEYTNMALEDTMGSGWARSCHPEDRERFVNKFLKTIAAGTPYEDEARFRGADGRYRWFLCRGRPFRDETGKVVRWYGANFDIDDRKQAEARVTRTEAELRLAMDTIPAMAWSAAPDGAADFVSRGWVEYTGMSLDETKGSGWSSAIHPSDRVKFVDNFLKAVAAGTAYEDEGRIRRADGQYRCFLVRAIPFRDEAGNIVRWYGACTDIEDRKAAENALRESEQRFRDFSEASADWYWETGPDHRFTFVPVGRPESANVVNPDVIGRTRWEIAADVENAPAKWQEHIGILNSHKPFRNFIYPVLRQDGSTMYVAVSGIPKFAHDGLFLGYRGGGSDVTVTVRADQMEDSLQQAQIKLAHVTRLTTLGELTATIAHEINQPLAGVIGNGAACLRWLSKDPPQFYGEVRVSIEAMISDANRASDIVARIRALAKNTAPQMAILEINDVVKEAIALVRREVEDSDVLLYQDLAIHLPPITGDRIQLQQVFINLIMNSVDALEGVTGRAREIVIRSSESEDHQIDVQVKDSGVGVDPAKIDGLFEAFSTTKPKGLGMGLSISRSIIEAHDGRLTIMSDGRTGATVQIKLPSRPTGRSSNEPRLSHRFDR
jgi:PAS domain S-box-containing protein